MERYARKLRVPASLGKKLEVICRLFRLLLRKTCANLFLVRSDLIFSPAAAPRRDSARLVPPARCIGGGSARLSVRGHRPLPDRAAGVLSCAVRQHPPQGICNFSSVLHKKGRRERSHVSASRTTHLNEEEIQSNSAACNLSDSVLVFLDNVQVDFERWHGFFPQASGTPC